MTWLKGSTTVGSLAPLINRLICAEVADGSSNTCASGDKWLREFTRTVTDGVLNSTTTLTSATAAFTSADVGAYVYGTGITFPTTIASFTSSTTVVMSQAATTTTSGVTVQICFDTIKTLAAFDVATGNMSNRTGYCAMVNGDNTLATGRATVCRVSNPFTSDPTTSGSHQWLVSLIVQTPNTISGNYSTATIVESVIDAQTGASILTSTVRAVTAGGVVTCSSGSQYTISDPSGILPPSTAWARGFTATYLYGIDLWPMLYRQGNTAPSFSVAPPGVAGTDYDIVRIPHGLFNQGNLTARGLMLHGLGIKTATGNGSPGSLYTVAWSMALIKQRIFLANNGTLGLDVGQSMNDTNAAGLGIKNVGGVRTSTWNRFATTAGSMLSSTAVQYWLSVKSDGIAIVLNADPGNTGKMGSSWVGNFTPYDTTYDVFPTSFNVIAQDYTADNTSGSLALTTQYSYLSQRRRQDGSESARDWQTKWMRCDHLGTGYAGTHSNDPPNTNGGVLPGANGNVGIPLMSAVGENPAISNGATLTVTGIPLQQPKPVAMDAKWWLYGTQYAEGAYSSATLDENQMFRGYQNARYFWAPGSNWISGDELTDTGTSTVYFLITPDYCGLGARGRIATNSYSGGLAIKEI